MSAPILSDPVPQPYLGKPFTVPGRIEAEYWDLGGEGLGYHFSGKPITNLFFRYPDSQGRPGEAMVASRGASTNAVLQTGEWLNYTIDCETAGRYTLLLKTEGPPRFANQYWWGPFEQYEFLDAPADLRLELDGKPLQFRSPVQRQMLLPDVQISKGPHSLRLVGARISDARGMGNWWIYPNNGEFELFTVSVDWMEWVPARPPVARSIAAGGTPGFRDGWGTNAQIGGISFLIGQRSTGDVLFFDGVNAALRSLSLDHEVRTIAGHPGNPVRDGPGDQAGFKGYRDALLSADDTLFLLENDLNGVSRVRRVDSGGTVNTLYSGILSVTVPDIRPGVLPGNTTNRSVTLSRLVEFQEGELNGVGMLDDYTFEVGPGPWQAPEWHPYTRYVWFRLGDREPEVLMNGSGPALPNVRTNDLGGGLRYEWSFSGRLLAEGPPGFVQDLIPRDAVYSLASTRDGPIYAVLESGSIHQLFLDEGPVLLSIAVEGSGSVAGVPETPVRRGSEVTVTAVPSGRFSVFDHWSDGSVDSSRTLRIDQDLSLVAWFTMRTPGPNGIAPGSVRLGGGGRTLLFSIVGDAQGYRYALEQSQDLQNWSPLSKLPVVLSGNAWGSLEQFDCYSDKAQLSVPVSESAHFIRARLLP
ncbi:MAG: hypothetical protein U1G08_20390 [Verrucomicrobiota bacterium]